MSSLFAHTLIGAALFTRTSKVNSWRRIVNCSLVMFLAITPDIDYVIYWLFDYRLNPRYTHSIFYCLLISAIFSVIKLAIPKNGMAYLPYWLLWVAPLTHLAMDLLVGVYPMPLYWPLNSDLVVLPFGILPSAGRLDILNYYFWRNLFIESGIILPVVIFFIPFLNRRIIKNTFYRKALLLLVLCTFCFWGASLSRS